MRLTAKSEALKATAVLDPSAFVNVRIPANEPRVALTISLPTGTVSAAVNSKSLRKVITTVSEAEDPDTIAVVLQGRLEGSNLLDAGISAIVKTAKPAVEAAAAGPHNHVPFRRIQMMQLLRTLRSTSNVISI